MTIQDVPNLLQKMHRYTYWINKNAYLNKILESIPITSNEFKHAINSLIGHSSFNELSMNEMLANIKCTEKILYITIFLDFYRILCTTQMAIIPSIAFVNRKNFYSF